MPEATAHPALARMTRMLDRRSVLGSCVGTGLIVFGILTGHTLTDGNCDETRLGPIPTSGQACARIAGTWTPSTGAPHIAYLATQILSWALIAAGAAIILAGFTAELRRALARTGKQSPIACTISHMTQTASDLGKVPFIPRAVAIGATAGLTVGGIAGLIRGIEVHLATAWFAAFELGAPGAIAGIVIGLTSGLLLTAGRLINTRLRRPHT